MEEDETEQDPVSAVRIPGPPDQGGFSLIFPLFFFCKIGLTLKETSGELATETESKVRGECNNMLRDFPGHPVAQTSPHNAGDSVRSLVRKLDPAC